MIEPIETGGVQPPHQSKALGNRVGEDTSGSFPSPYSRLSLRSPHVQVQGIGSSRNTDALVGAVFGLSRAETRTTQMRIWSRRTRKRPRFMEPDEYTNLIVAPSGISSSAGARAVLLGRQRKTFCHQRAIRLPCRKKTRSCSVCGPATHTGWPTWIAFFSASTTTSITICAASTCSSSP